MPASDGTQAMWNPFASMPAVAGHQVQIVRGEGATVYDADGRAYLDAIASLWYCNVGYGRTELGDAAAVQMHQIAGYQTYEAFSNKPAEELAERVAALSPIDGAKVFFTPGGGSDAVDTVAKLARAYWRAVGKPGKQVIVGRSHAYHGVNGFGTSLGGIPVNAEAFGQLVPEVEHVPWDDAAALAKLIDQAGADRVAAFICEPVVGAGGVYFPPEGYLADVQHICRDADVLFIADEVITGFGRAGAWFGSQRYDIRPDLMTVAKGLTSGYLPLGGVLASPRVAEPFWRPGSAEVFRHGYTYTGHPAACAVALANLDILEREQLVARVRELEPALAAALAPVARHELVSEVRTGAGLLAGIEIAPAARQADPGLAGRVVTAARQRGVITRLLRGVALQVSPPFVITATELHQLAEVLTDSLDAVS
ncbi:MAG TPA: aspartate aminotransferase family protein [Streptosporangiaceae bacterium]|jgi:adenosylmethionine-8-amino-7-oxononanoate aminotransferase